MPTRRTVLSMGLLGGLGLAVAPSTAAQAATPTTTIDIISDIQGEVGNRHLREKVLPTLNARGWPGKALVVNGDLVAAGSTANWSAYRSALTANSGHVSGRVIPAIGNHEYYGPEGSSTYRSRFLQQAGRSTLWTEQVIDGVPLLVVGSESYDYAGQNGAPPFIDFSQQQLDWFAGRMAYWAARNTPALIVSHHVLPNSVTGTDRRFYLNDFGDQLDDFLAILRTHSSSVLITAHTHWRLTDPKWTVLHPIGGGKTMRVVNCGSVANAYGPKGTTEEQQLAGEYSSGLRVHAFADRFQIEAWDFMTGTLITQVNHPR